CARDGFCCTFGGEQVCQGLRDGTAYYGGRFDVW
nr:immunoglobulin heavy chain junction region [Macaca mulatta]